MAEEKKEDKVKTVRIFTLKFFVKEKAPMIEWGCNIVVRDVETNNTIGSTVEIPLEEHCANGQNTFNLIQTMGRLFNGPLPMEVTLICPENWKADLQATLTLCSAYGREEETDGCEGVQTVFTEGEGEPDREFLVNYDGMLELVNFIFGSKVRFQKFDRSHGFCEKCVVALYGEFGLRAVQKKREKERLEREAREAEQRNEGE